MNYITRVIIENFQSHKKSELEFVNGLNVIVGPSDQGKSAVIRAIKWLLFNEPRGNEFIRTGENFARVEIEFSNGYRITRERSPSKNRYNIIGPDGETKVFEGFGNDVPEEVKAVHGIYKVLIDSDSSVCLNIGDQLEAPFLIAETGSTKAKAIGRLTGVHVLDNAIRECISDIKRESQLLSKSKKETEGVNEKLNLYKDLARVEKSIHKCEGFIQKVIILNERNNKLKKFKNEYININDEIKELQKVLEEITNVESAEDIVNLLSTKIKYIADINDIYTRFIIVNKAIQQNEAILEDTKGLKELYNNIKTAGDRKLVYEKLTAISRKYSEIINEIKKTEEKALIVKNTEKSEEVLTKIINLKNKNEKVNKLTDSYNNLINSINEGERYISRLKEEMDTNLGGYKGLLKKISKCPVCFSDIDEVTIERVLKQYEERNDI